MHAFKVLYNLKKLNIPLSKKNHLLFKQNSDFLKKSILPHLAIKYP